MRIRTVKAKGEDTVQLYSILSDYSWVDGFLKSREIQKQISALKLELKRLNALPLSKSYFRDRLKKGYEEIKQNRVEWLRKLFLEYRNSQYPFEFYAARISALNDSNLAIDERFTPFVAWDEIEAALGLLPEKPGALTLREKEAKLLTVERELAELKTKLTELSPDVFFIKKDGRIMGDSREELVQIWWKIQNSMSQPCDPFGWDLKFSTSAEQKAWKKLMLSQAVNPYSRLFPDPGKDTLPQ